MTLSRPVNILPKRALQESWEATAFVVKATLQENFQSFKSSLNRTKFPLQDKNAKKLTNDGDGIKEFNS